MNALNTAMALEGAASLLLPFLPGKGQGPPIQPYGQMGMDLVDMLLETTAHVQNLSGAQEYASQDEFLDPLYKAK